MDRTKLLGDGWELPARRSLDDFLLESSRFQLPNFKDLEKWGNRVVNNLVYYQTNYLYMCIAIMLALISVNLMSGIVGVSAIMTIWAGYFFFCNESESALRFKRNYPLVGIICTVVIGYCVIRHMYSILYILFGILLSFCVIFIHASLRLRNLKNKLVNKIEGIGFERTPMSIILNYFGMKEEFVT